MQPVRVGCFDSLRSFLQFTGVPDREVTDSGYPPDRQQKTEDGYDDVEGDKAVSGLAERCHFIALGSMRIQQCLFCLNKLVFRERTVFAE